MNAGGVPNTCKSSGKVLTDYSIELTLGSAQQSITTQAREVTGRENRIMCENTRAADG